MGAGPVLKAQRTAVLNVAGLTPALLRHAPFLREFAERGAMASIEPVFPAVTCSAQATYLTGALPRDHGIVANGWYDRDECEVKFWKQSNKLVQRPKLWERARAMDASFSCANLFWWYNMYSTVDVSVTPRPMYPADGRKLPDIHTTPGELRPRLQETLGQFPLFEFWGPGASIASSRWIVEAAKRVEQNYHPSLSLIYLPHLDYNLQRLGPNDPAIAKDVAQVDGLCRELVGYYETQGVSSVVLSEYGIAPVRHGIAINRVLRRHGLLRVRDEVTGERLDAGASVAFAVPDHQVAHVYVNEPRQLTKVRALLEGIDGVAEVLDRPAQRHLGLDHPRAGDLIAVAETEVWFSYYYWFEDRKAPDFARTVDIHRKPGYDPVELFIDPALRWPKLRVAKRLLQKQLGFRYLMDLVSLDDSLVRGSHGRVGGAPADGPLFITPHAEQLTAQQLPATAVHDLLLAHLFPNSTSASENNSASQEAGAPIGQLRGGLTRK